MTRGVYRRRFQAPPRRLWAPSLAAAPPAPVVAPIAPRPLPARALYGRDWAWHRQRLARSRRDAPPAVFVPPPPVVAPIAPRPLPPRALYGRDWIWHRQRLARSRRVLPPALFSQPVVPSVVPLRRPRLLWEIWERARWAPHRARLARPRPFLPRWSAPPVPPPTIRITPAKTRVVYVSALDYYDPEQAIDGTLWLVSKTSRGINTRADDDPASTHAIRRLLEFEGHTHAFAPGRIGGTPELLVGTLVADNRGSRLSRVAKWRFNGRGVRVWRLRDGSRPQSWERVYTGHFIGQPSVDRERVAWSHVAGIGNLDRPLQQRTFSGAGGDEGDASVEALTQPLVFGKALNITPRGPAGFSTGTYKAHDGRVQSLTATANLEKGFTSNATPDVEGAAPQCEAIYNRTFSNAAWTKSNVAVSAAAGVDGLIRDICLTATVNNGTVTQTLSGLAGKSTLHSFYALRLNGSGSFSLRMDGATLVPVADIGGAFLRYELRITGPTEIRYQIGTAGDSFVVDFSMPETPDPLFPSWPIETTSAAVKDYRSSAARLLGQMASQCLGLVPYIDIDAAALEALHAAEDATVGIYVAGGEQALEAMFAVTDSILAYPVVDMATGMLGAKRLRAPASSPAKTLTEGRSIAGRLHGGNIRKIEVLQATPAIWRATVGGTKDWTPGTNRQGTIARDRVDRDVVRAAVRLGVDLGAYRAKEAVNLANRTEWGETAETDVSKLTLLDGAADLQTMADYMLALRGVERRVFRVETDDPPGSYVIDDDVAVTHKDVTYDGMGAPLARNMVVLGTSIRHAVTDPVAETLTVEVWG